MMRSPTFFIVFSMVICVILAEPRGRRTADVTGEKLFEDLSQQMQSSELMKSLKDSLTGITGENSNMMASLSENVAKLVEGFQGGELSNLSNLDISEIGKKLNLDSSLSNLDLSDIGKRLKLDSMLGSQMDLRKFGEKVEDLGISNFGELSNFGGLTGGLDDEALTRAFSNLRSLFQSMVGEGHGLGYSPDQIAEEFLRTATERFSMPELNAFLSGVSGDGFVQLVRDSSLQRLPELLGHQRRLGSVFQDAPFWSMEKLLHYTTNNGFVSGLSAQETADLLFKEAAVTGQLDQFNALLSSVRQRGFQGASIVGAEGLQKYSDEVMALLTDRIPFGTNGIPFSNVIPFGGAIPFGSGGGSGTNGIPFSNAIPFGGGIPFGSGGGSGRVFGLGGFGGFAGSLINQASRYTGTGYGSPDARRRLREEQPVTDSAVFNRMVSYTDGAGIEPSRIADNFARYLQADGRTVGDFLSWASVNPGSLPGSEVGRMTVGELSRKSHGGRRLTQKSPMDVAAEAYLNSLGPCHAQRKTPEQCALQIASQTDTMTVEQIGVLNTMLTALADTGAKAVPRKFCIAVQLNLIENLSERAADATPRQLQAFGSILNPSMFFSKTLAEIGNEALAEGISPQIAADRWLAALNSFGLPGGSITEFLESGFGNVGFLGDIARAAQTELQNGRLAMFPQM